MNKRIRRLGIAMIVLYLGLFLQLNNIQLVRAHALASSKSNPRNQVDAYAYPRGDIRSADGVLLATSVPVTGQGSDKYQRVYPEATAALFSQIVGFDSIIYGNNYGVEAEYNSSLTVHISPVTSVRDLLANRTTVDDVTLTVSAKLQQEVYNALIAGAHGQPAGAVVLDPTTGAVLAMASVPVVDPNPLVSLDASTEHRAWTSYNADPSKPLLSNAFEQRYSPGSTFKVVTTGAVLQDRPDLAATTYPSVTQITLPDTGGQPLTNYRSERCGGPLVELFYRSCDADFATIGQKLGARTLAMQADLEGFDKPSPVDLPGAAPSVFGSAASFTGDLPALMKSAIGQENVSATPLQMAMVAAGVANGGVIMTPHVMEQIRDNQGNLVTVYRPTPFARVLTQQNAGTLSTFMQDVVSQPLGTAFGVFPSQWDVAAKTGTAQTSLANNLTNDWMVAFAPASHPQVAVAVVVPNQPGFTFGAGTAGPIVRAIIGDSLALG